MKNLLRLVLSLLTIGVSVTMLQVQAEDFPYTIDSSTQLQGDNEPTNLQNVIKQDTLTPKDSILNQMRNFFRLSKTKYDTNTPAIDYIKWILNILLGLVSFISLVLIIFAFYLIFFGKEEENVGKAKKILKGVAIALIVMGLSWFIVSFFFDIFKKTT